MFLEVPKVEMPSADGVGIITQWRALEGEMKVMSGICHSCYIQQSLGPQLS